MGSCSAPGEPINQYALVTYLPDELGFFLDQLRRDLVAQCNARSHLSLLPPRPIQVASSEAEAQIQAISRTAQPFVVGIGGINVFPRTSVIYLELNAGQGQIENFHSQFSSGALEFEEPFPFHPHITLAQNFAPETVEERLELAKQQWAAYQGPKEFLLDRVVFVQNSDSNCWRDLKTFPLLGLPNVPTMSNAAQLIRTY